ncbi:hypothetical protein [Polaribacter sp.]|uniref:hypothetical protein n=1 Tax=Polaribacter sp. TaxID=1920175 RepID=UPI003F6C335B
MTEKEIIKYLDLVFKGITDFNAFSTNNILFKIIKPNDKVEKERNSFFEIIKEVERFGKNNDLFEQISTQNWYKLTPKGKELKLSSLGFIKFTKKSKPKKFDLYKIVPIILTIVFGISTFYFALVNYRLKLQESKVPSLELKVDSLKKELNRINNKLIEYKVNTLTDTLETKKESD